MSNKPIYNAIVFFDPSDGKKPRKYRNISNLQNFLKFARNSGARYTNLYNALDRKFAHREWLRGPSA